jgi:hypothetical protein
MFFRSFFIKVFFFAAAFAIFSGQLPLISGR